MLGATVTETLAAVAGLSVTATVRHPSTMTHDLAARVKTGHLDARSCSTEELVRVIQGATWVVNCIGLIKPHIRDSSSADTAAAIRINAMFPHLLALAAEEVGARVLQIATDCVYSGRFGGYRESDPHDALDVYGKTKSLGEVASAAFHHLRCSIVGHEVAGRTSLLEWFLGQKENASVIGYTDHYWNGVTTVQFARFCRGIICEEASLPGTCHVVPYDSVTKAQLLEMFASAYERTDIRIQLAPTGELVNRTLATEQEELNLRLWSLAGYAAAPTIETMIREMAEWQQARLRDPK
jgi:dTDP-4-dehydrorhamnose reductase